MYGITETTVHVTYKKITFKDIENVTTCIGRRLNDLTAYVLDSRLQPVPIGVPAELHIGGEGLARGYLNRSDLTKERFIDNPFVSEEDKAMNYNLIKLHNEVVAAKDTVYFLGDLTLRGADCRNALEKLVGHMNGKKILVMGNHDQLNPFTYVDIGFESVHTSLSLLLPHGEENEYVHLVHDPALAAVDRSSFFLCGHIHGLFQQVGNAINVGVDAREFKPVSSREIWEIIKSIMGR